jgi:hypothetical protein
MQTCIRFSSFKLIMKSSPSTTHNFIFIQHLAIEFFHASCSSSCWQVWMHASLSFVCENFPFPFPFSLSLEFILVLREGTWLWDANNFHFFARNYFPTGLFLLVCYQQWNCNTIVNFYFLTITKEREKMEK